MVRRIMLFQPECDFCFCTLAEVGSRETAVGAMIEAGWKKAVIDRSLDVCPECAKRDGIDCVSGYRFERDE